MITIKVECPHGGYWTAYITTADGANSVAASGKTPKDAVIAAMCLLSWFNKQEGPNTNVTGLAPGNDEK